MHTLNSVYHSHPTIMHGRSLSNTLSQHQNEDSHSNIYTEPTVVNDPVLEPDPGLVPAPRNHLEVRHNSVHHISNHSLDPPNSRLEFYQPNSVERQNHNHIQEHSHHQIHHNNEQQIIAQNSVQNAQFQPVQQVSPEQCELPMLVNLQYPVPEFLPLCDLLFNIISLAGYFCDIVFDGIIAYTLYLNRHIFLMSVAVGLILFSGGVSQVLSYRWHKRDRKIQQQLANRQQLAGGFDGPILSGKIAPSITLMHILYSGVLWRYFKLFTPVDLSSIKREVRDLCVLRMVHAFCQAAPMLLLQLYLLWRKPSPDAISDLNMISIFLSAFSLCWALASFSKNIRTDAIDKLVLTWLGVIFQFLWRLGTITSRVVSLTIYQHVYGAWIFAVLIMHWFSMLLWLLSPQLVLYFEHTPGQLKQLRKKEKFIQIAGTAWVYCFCFINMENEPPRQRMIAFYVTMFMENVLLMALSVYFDYRPYRIWYRNWVIFLVLGGFAFGLFFLWIYYRFFHIRHLSSGNNLEHQQLDPALDPSGDPNSAMLQLDGQCQVPARVLRHNQMILSMMSKDKMAAQKSDEHNMNLFLSSANINMALSHQQNLQNIQSKNLQNAQQLQQQNGGFEPSLLNAQSAGVFNCRLNPALKRKKKKPSTVPPPPQAAIQTLATIGEHSVIQPQPRRSKSAVLSPQMYCNTAANSAFVTKQLCQSGTDTFWRKSALSARSMSTSPAVVNPQLISTSNVQGANNNSGSSLVTGDFRLPSKHPFSSSITSPKPMNVDLSQLEGDNKIIRPKPLMLMQNQSIDLDAIGSMLQNQMQTSRSHTFEYVSPEDEDSFSKQGARPPVPGKEGDSLPHENTTSGVKLDFSPESALSRSRMEKVLESKRNLEAFEVESYRSHQTFSNETHRSRTTNRSKKQYSSGMLRKKRAHGSSLRVRRRKHDSFSSGNSSNHSSDDHESARSSGGEGDIESDNGQSAARHFRSKSMTHVHVHSTPSELDPEEGVDPVILVAKNLLAKTDSSSQRIINYHGNNNNADNRPNANANRQLRTMYSAKYKRHNTPL